VITEAKELARMTGLSVTVTIGGEEYVILPIRVRDLPAVMVKVTPAIQEIAKTFPNMDISELTGAKLPELFGVSTKLMELVVFVIEAVTKVPALKLMDASAVELVDLVNVVIDQNFNLITSLKKTINLVKNRG
jgi:hypothetical protein